jgi:hypothetical protein
MWKCSAARATHDRSATTALSAAMNATLHDATVVHQPRKPTVALRSRGAVVISRVRSQKRGEAKSVGCR